MSTNGGTAARDAAARRRRIAERGSERLAFITGRAHPVSSSPLLPSEVESHHSSTVPCPPPLFRNPDKRPLSDEKSDSSFNTETAGGKDVGSDIEPLLSNPEGITEASAQPSFEPSKTQFASIVLSEQAPPISTPNKSQKPKSQTHLHETLTPDRLRPAITSSDSIRRNCSVITALLVLLSYAGFPVVSSNMMKSILLWKPLVLLILTNITIVIAPALLGEVKQKDHRGSSMGDAGLGSQLGRVLEWGMLMKTGLSALFMDCSVYSVVLVCGMSILQKLGW